jgi:hypothetical protein
MHTKTPITLRVDPALLAAARGQAQAENRTLTNYIETVLKERLDQDGGEGARAHTAAAQSRGHS